MTAAVGSKITIVSPRAGSAGCELVLAEQMRLRARYYLLSKTAATTAAGQHSPEDHSMIERNKAILRREVRCLLLAVATIAPLAYPLTAAPPEPGWAKQIVPTGQERAIIKVTPIEQRPYRPFHFYGNTLRRLYYRGNPIPAPRDIISTAAGIRPTR